MKLFSKTLKALLILLGIIHDAATFTPIINGGMGTLTASKINAITYMSLMCGTSLILCGALLLALCPYKSTGKDIKIAKRIICVFLALAGVLAVAYMPHNSFAWITFCLCGLTIIVESKNLGYGFRTNHQC